MRLVSTILNPKLSLAISFLLVSIYASAQANSPFSRYGLGDPLPGQNIINRAMGSTAATYSSWQSINFSNPASYGDLKVVTYDIGLSLDSRTLKSASPVLKYNSINLTPSYVTLGVPLSKKRRLGLAFGLRPLTNISYSVQDRKKLPADSVLYLYEGDGGLYQAFVGIGKRWGGLQIGFNTGYMFGRKENNTRTIPLDSVFTYKSNSKTLTTYSNAFIHAGIQYEAALSKKTSLRIGFAGNLNQKLDARQTISRETFTYNANGSPVNIDTVYQSQEVKGSINLPASYLGGISLNSYVLDRLGNKIEKGVVAVEYESTQWNNYRFLNQTDQVANSYLLKVGAQLTPNPLSTNSYWNRVTYRAGFYFGKEHITAEGDQLPVYAVTLGAGFRIRNWRSFVDNQYTNINTTFEVGRRGNNNNNITESFFRFSIGFNLSDVWFIKRKYD